MNGSASSAGRSLSVDSTTVILSFFAVGNVLNGLWMLADPPHWYETLPAAVPDFGPLNEHFVRDIGAVFLLMGIGLAVAAARPAWRLPVLAGATGFHVLHAFVHVIDTGRGLVGPEHWLIDLPGVYLPAIVLSWLTWVVRRSAP